MRLSGRTIAGLLLCAEHYAAPYDLLTAALNVQPARLRGIVARWRSAGYARTGTLGPGPAWCWLTREGMAACGTAYPARPPALARHDQTTAIQAELQAIEDAAPVKDNDLTLIDELPYAPGMLAQAPARIRETIAAAFDIQCLYRPDHKQATVVLTITDATPAIITALLTDNDTAAGTTPATFADIPDGAITTETRNKSNRVPRHSRPYRTKGRTWTRRADISDGWPGPRYLRAVFTTQKTLPSGSARTTKSASSG